MKIKDYILNIGRKFDFIDRFGKKRSMRATDIYNAVMHDSKESDYNWIASAKELVKLCKNENFPIEYSTEIEMAILICFANQSLFVVALVF